MVTVRPTKMLARQLGIRVPKVAPHVSSHVADWCAHHFHRGHESWLIFCNTASLYPVFAGAGGVIDGESLVRRVGGMVLQVLKTNRFRAQAKIFERELVEFQWAPIPDRSVLGSVNELVWQADAYFDDLDLTPAKLSLHLGETPMSTLGMNSPERAFASLRE